jgi:hypothetical protein
VRVVIAPRRARGHDAQMIKGSLGRLSHAEMAALHDVLALVLGL